MMPSVIEAAGGLLWRNGLDSVEIAVVHRTRYNGDWTLPKGKLHPDETPLNAALREVREETGYSAVVHAFLGCTTYQTPNGQKLVRYWSMTPKSGDSGALDRDEVVEILWLTPQEACCRLTYPLEKALVEAFMSNQQGPNISLLQAAPKQGGWLRKTGRRIRLWWVLKDIAYENLGLQLPVVKTEFQNLCTQLAVMKPAWPWSGAWMQGEQALLSAAENNAIRDPELAWRFVKAAERSLLFAHDALNHGPAAAACASSLLAETKDKLQGWRQKAVLSLLDTTAPIPVWKIAKAAKLVDEHHDNGYRRLKILRKRLRVFGAASLVVTAVYVLLAPQLALPVKAPSPDIVSRASLLGIAFMGLVGAVVSVLTSTKSVSSDRVPVQQAQTSVLLGRLALGPISALAMAAILATGVVSGFQSHTSILIAAMLAGFSERFLLNGIEAFTKKG